MRLLRQCHRVFRQSSNIKFGTGAKPNEIPTALEQSTGAERLEYVSELQGIDPFDMSVDKLTTKGTEKVPVIVKSLGMNDRVVGCRGVGQEAHDVVWIFLEGKALGRCPECGNTFQLDDEVGKDAHH